MSNDWKRHLIHAISHSIRHERAHGNVGTANGLGYIALGIILLPIPIIGVPLLITGIWKICKL